MLNELRNRLSTDPKGFSFEYGNFHDCRVTAFEVRPADKSLLIAVDDLYSNFLDLPEYKGPMPVKFILSGVEVLDVNVEIKDGELNIFDMEFMQNEDEARCSVVIKFSPGGSAEAVCESIAIEE